jgi:hypothetical protein
MSQFLIAGDNIFTVENTLPARLSRRKQATIVEASPRRANSAAASQLAAGSLRAPRISERPERPRVETVTLYEPKAELAGGLKLGRLERLKRDARHLRGKAEKKSDYVHLLSQIASVERQAYLASDVLAAVGTLVEDDEQVSQSEINEAKTLLRELIAEATS